MSDLCEQYCPVYETCIRTFDAGSATRSSLLDQYASLSDMSGIAEVIEKPEYYADPAKLSDSGINQPKAQHRAQIAAERDAIQHRITLNEADLASAARGIMECAAAQIVCPGPKLNLLGRMAVGLYALRHLKRPTETDRHRQLEQFAQCASAAAKSAIAGLPEPPY